ncbi:MAG TPA: hypothetical protein VGE07_23620 [Herpetosiphonaceae bacterium]
MGFWIDLETGAGVRVGPGPIRSAPVWSMTRRLDRAGEIGFAMPVSDPRTAYVQEKRLARCKTVRGGALVELGVGIIDQISASVDAGDTPMLDVAGNDILAELGNRSVGFLELTDGAGGPTATALASIMAFAPAGWSLDTVNGFSSTASTVYLAFAGESVLEALIKLAEATGEHFRLGDGKKVVWLRTSQPSSGVRAIQGGDSRALEDNPNVAIITDLQEVRDSYELVTRVYPFGAGNNEARLTLANTTRVAPVGYSLDLVNNCIVNTTAESTYGQIDSVQGFKDITELAAGATDPISAANQLFDTALAWLRRRSAIQKTYQLTITKLDKALEPGQTIRVVYRKTIDGYVSLNIDANLVILEAAHDIDEAGVRTVGLVVSTIDRWPATDDELLASALSQQSSMESHLQPVVNPYDTFLELTDTPNSYGGQASKAVRVNAGATALEFYTPTVGTVTSVGATAPITSSGGATPTIAITPATTGAAGSMSASDKVKLDALPQAPYAANQFLASPDTGLPGAIGMRQIVDADIPSSIARDTEVTAAIVAHVALADPHAQYQRESERAAANGYASLDGSTKVPAAQIPTATTSAVGGVAVPASGGLELSGNNLRRALGTAFPGSPATNQTFFRTDYGLEFYYDGSRWLTINEYPLLMPYARALQPISVAGVVADGLLEQRTGLVAYVTHVYARTNVQTTNNGSNYWTITVNALTAAAVVTVLATWDTSADAASTNIKKSATPGTLLTSSDLTLNINTVKTAGAPGSLFVTVEGRYRIRAT